MKNPWAGNLFIFIDQAESMKYLQRQINKKIKELVIVDAVKSTMPTVDSRDCWEEKFGLLTVVLIYKP